MKVLMTIWRNLHTKYFLNPFMSYHSYHTVYQLLKPDLQLKFS
jgi:hypothetical protein